MNFNVAQLLKDPVGSVRSYDLDDVLAAPGEPWDGSRILGNVRLLRTHRGVLVTGRLHTTAPATCGWCLEPMEQSLDLEIEEEYFPTLDVNTGLPVEIPEDSAPFTIDSHHILDLSEACRQAIVLAMPISPRCRDDCQGLCPECGVNRNMEQCGCGRPGDSRWSQLGALLAQWESDKRRS